jgi:cellulose synthase/poly-beta-1,6-N-acetylglucosamine synthase-like glycosyltransferase
VPVSIVISAKNEAHHLIRTLPLYLQQLYPQFEVVVVNDNSTDETANVIRDFMTQHPHLKLVDLTSSVTNIQGKKFPLSIGIKAASYDTLLLTDANTFPSSVYWLQNMANHFTGKTEVVLGYSTFEKKPGFLNRFIHYDTMHTALQYFSYSLAGIPYMGNGKNLAYTKSLFMGKKGFASLNHLKYGDDDLFVAQIANKNNCKIEYYKNSHTFSHSKQRLKDWFAEKRRHSSTFRYYKTVHKFLLNTYSLFTFLFFVVFGFALFFSFQNRVLLAVLLGIFVVKTGFQYFLFGKAASKLNEKNVIPFILFFDILFAVFNLFFFILSIFTRRK